MIDFGLSAIIKDEISDEQMKEIFYVFGADYYVWPLEVHYMAYIINENNGTKDTKPSFKIFMKTLLRRH